MSVRNEPRPPRRSLGELALNVGAVAGAVCLLVAAVSMVFGVTPLVFRSGSMSPEIPTGSLALARTASASELRVGDVVSVDDANGTRITHRVVNIDSRGDQAVLTLKGDANRDADPVPYVVGEADRVLVSVPMLGYVAAWLSSKVAVFFGGLLAGALLTFAFGPLRRPDSAEPHPGPNSAGDGAESANSLSTQVAEASPAQYQENAHV